MAGGTESIPDDDSSMDAKGARVLAARIAEAKRRRALRDHQRHQRCVDCGGEIAEVLAVLGAVRCHDCRSTRRVV
jgi:DNA-directed RNA polymerase subunit RPC12/RpoP